tara:strand:- start:313 stop:888 length:576 start_codon:yes stop_codon:yes gene_type:complete
MKKSQLQEIVREVILENEIEAALKQTFNQIGKELQANKDDVVVDKEGKVDEALLTLAAGIALSGPTILKIIAKITKTASKFFGGKGATADKVIAAADRAHHFLIGIVEKIIGLFLPSNVDPKLKHKLAEGIFYLVIGGLLGHGSIEMAGKLEAGNISGAAVKGALNAVKSGEIVNYLRTFIKGAATGAGIA